MTNESLAAKALTIHERLYKAYGWHELRPRRTPMHELTSTMLSHRTTQANEALAYQRMWERFGSWEAIRDADLGDLIMAIAPATFPEVKAPRIQAVLRQIIAERGEASIEFLADLPVEEGLAWLLPLPGVGIKTASLVLLFCFSKPLLPVDTHVHRVSQRTGLIGLKVDATAAHPLLLALFPPDPPTLYNFHVNALRHGQRICTWRDPRCERCVLNDLCDWYQRRQGKDPPVQPRLFGDKDSEA